MVLPPFQALVDEHWRDVARLAYALAGPDDGEDCAQRAWERALAAYPTLGRADNLKGWLLTITARCAVDGHRARARRPVPAGDHLPEMLPEMLPEIPGSSHHERDDDLWNRVRALPERQRTAIALRYVVDLDHAEIARILDTTPAATRRLVSDALARLRKDLP